MILTDLFERTEATTFDALQPWNPQKVDPALMTRDEYLHLVNPIGKWHSDSAYDFGLGSLSYYNKADFKLLQRVKLRGIEFEFRIKIEERKFRTRNPEDDRYMTRDEVEAEGLKTHDYTIGVWTKLEGDMCIAATQDEWGCMLVTVAREYRGFGLGPILVKFARTLEPDKPSGGFTPSGRNNFIKVHREFVRDALRSGKYSRMVRAGEITMARVREIIASVDLSKKMSKRHDDLSTADPKNWLLYSEHDCFILYDRKLRDFMRDEIDGHWVNSAVKGHLYVAVYSDFARVKNVSGDKKLLPFFYGCALRAAREAGATLYVEPDDAPHLSGFKLGSGDYKAGYYAFPVLDGPTVDYAPMARDEAAWRKSFDRYDELLHKLHEIVF